LYLIGMGRGFIPYFSLHAGLPDFPVTHNFECNACPNGHEQQSTQSSPKENYFAAICRNGHMN
jgi:hypothetical protein